MKTKKVNQSQVVTPNGAPVLYVGAACGGPNADLPATV